MASSSLAASLRLRGELWRRACASAWTTEFATEFTWHSSGRQLSTSTTASSPPEDSPGTGTTETAVVDSRINPLQQAPGTGLLERETTTPASRYGAQHAHATLRGAKISPRKLNQFVDIIRGQHIEDALIQCSIHTKKAARMTGKLLESAKANAVNNHGLDGDNLKVDQAWVGKGQYLRRVSIHGRGRSGVMHKNRAHLTVVLKEEPGLGRRVQVMPPVWERRERGGEGEGEGERADISSP
jgi:large subunit ribosomal protein L22